MPETDHTTSITKTTEIECKGCGKTLQGQTELDDGYETEVCICDCGYANTNWTAKAELAKPKRRTQGHRNFFINGKREFAVFFNPEIVDKEVIVREFIESKDWKWYAGHFGVKVKSSKVSDDLLRVDIETEHTK